MTKRTVCLNMITKNENKTIQRCLTSVKSLIDYWVIVDTGSTDNTQETIKESLKGIPGELFERPWVHFAHNRNEAFALAKNKGGYLLIIDADEWIETSLSFILPELNQDYYATEYRHGTCRSIRVFLIDNRIDWKWKGVIHEAIDFSKSSGVLLKEVTKRHALDGNRSENVQKKNLRDALTLETALKEDPCNARYVFHLAGCYEAGEEYELALLYFEKRVPMGGDELEIYFSLYRIGALQEKLKMNPNIFINSYLRAFLFRPHRIEPLYYLTNYFIKTKAFFLGYLISQFALNIPFVDDFYFTQYQIYEYGLKNQLLECMFHLKSIPQVQNEHSSIQDWSEITEENMDKWLKQYETVA